MVNIEASDGIVSVQSNEFTLVNDKLYASINVDEAPEWLLALIDNEVIKSIASGMKDYDLLVQDVINAVSALDNASASYVTLTGFNDLVNGIVATRLEALTAQYDGVYATKIELTNLETSTNQAIAQNLSELSAEINSNTNAKITNLQTSMVTSNSALAEDITTLSTVLDGNTASVSELFQSIDGIEASWGIETDVNGNVAGIKLINSLDSPSKFVISTDVFEVRNADTGDLVIGTSPTGVPVVDATAIGGLTAEEVLNDLEGLLVDFENQNNRNSSAIINPTIQSNGTAIDHTINTDGSADISFEWGWVGNNRDIDGFVVVHYQSNSSSRHTFGANSSEEITYMVPSTARSFILRGVSANAYHTFGVVAYRKVDKDIAVNSTITSNTITPSLSSENPYRPESQVSFSGNIIGTIEGSSASSVKNSAYAGATFTSDNAGNLAYIDKVSTTHIENLAVNRLKIADESAGILKYSSYSNVLVGNGSAMSLASLSVYTPESANCLVQLSLQHDYTISGTGDKGSTVTLFLNGTLLQYRGMGAINDTPCITVGVSLPAGTNTFTASWVGNSSDVKVRSRSLSAYVSLR